MGFFTYWDMNMRNPPWKPRKCLRFKIIFLRNGSIFDIELVFGTLKPMSIAAQLYETQKILSEIKQLTLDLRGYL
jgi:hypothetical protein